MSDKPLGPVYIGLNMLTINQATMIRIVQDWIHVNHSGGPYKVVSVKQDETPPAGFVVMFEARAAELERTVSQ